MSFLKKPHKYFPCTVQVENYYSNQSTDVLSMVKDMKMFKTPYKDVLLTMNLNLAEKTFLYIF